MNDQTRQRIRRAYSQLAGDPVIGDPQLPSVQLDRQTLIDNGIFGFENLDIRSRAFALLRSQLLRGFHRSGGRTLAVTSTQSGNGKTYITANLAASLSCIHPIVLVDLDLRRPSLAERFGVAVTCGVDDYLAGTHALSDIACAAEGCRLTLCGVREARTDSATLLQGTALTSLFEEISALPDAPICIVDTPPVLVLDDAMIISRAVDGVLMVVEEGRTRAGDLAEALRLLAPVPIVGSVLNKSLTATDAMSVLRGDRYENYYGGEH